MKTHVTHVFSKLGLRDRAQAVVLAYESGLVEPRLGMIVDRYDGSTVRGLISSARTSELLTTGGRGDPRRAGAVSTS